MQLDAKIPVAPLPDKWDRCKFEMKLVSPANKRKFDIIVVGTGLAGGAASASLAELGYNVKTFCIQDSPRRAHSIAAQGGINAAKNYPNDGDSIWRLFYDTIKGGDFRAREGNVYRLAQVSNLIIDHCVAQGIPFAREYGGLLANRSFGGAQVSRTFYARGQTGQQLLLGAYSSLMRQVAAGRVTMFPRREMLDLVLVDGQARGIVVRNLITGEIERHSAHAVVLATGGYGNVFFLSTNGMTCNVTASFRAYKKGAGFANPCFTQIHPTCIPVHGDYQSKLTLMSESLRNDGRVWVPKQPGDQRPPEQIPEDERDYYLERIYPSFGNLAPRDISSRAAKLMCDQGKGVGPTGRAVYLDFADAIKRLGKGEIEARYGNLFQMYEKIVAQNPYETPMMIYPASHYTMGGLWVDYNLMSTIPGLFVLGEANFSDHGANRLGASALMQGLADGYFIIPYTIGGYLGGTRFPEITTDHESFQESEAYIRERVERLLNIKGKRTVQDFHREMGNILWEHCGMGRTDAGLTKARGLVADLKGEFWKNVTVPGEEKDLNQSLENAGRVADFLEFADIMIADALARRESCGCHFNEAFQTEDHEALRDDENMCHVAVWEYAGDGQDPIFHKEPLVFENVKLVTKELQVSGKTMNLTLKVWRQQGAAPGRLETYPAENIPTDASFLEMLDIVNERLTLKGIEPIAFDHDCREGICGMCGSVVNGRPHGPEKETTLCQLHMRHFKDRDTLVIEPFRARAYPIIKDLVVDRSALDQIIAAGGFVSVNTGQAPEANTLPVPKENADLAMDAAACIGCGACVAACPNATAFLFTGAKISQFALLPHGRPEAAKRALAMLAQMDKQGFGNCTNHRECEMECPKGISISNIARLNREWLKAALLSKEKVPA